MYDSILDVAVIGAGHAGLSMSYYLKQLGLQHMVFEQNKIGNTWRSQRWDSFKLNTPNNFTLLPGMVKNYDDLNGFCTAGEFVLRMEDYARRSQLPVMEEHHVLSVKQTRDSKMFSIIVEHKGQISNYISKKVVIASGSQNKEIIPELSARIPADIIQLHACTYRNTDTLPDGPVLVVGSGQSGVQIAEDLAVKGKTVYLSTSMVPRIPRRYRGKDIFEWLNLIGFFDHRPEDLDPEMLKMKQPQVSGVGPAGKTVSLQSLARNGVIILGKLGHADDDQVYFQPNAANHLKFADGFSKKVKDLVDEYITKTSIDAPPSMTEPADMPGETAGCISPLLSLNFKERHFNSIIWTTGFKGDFTYLDLPVATVDGTLIHKSGISGVAGLYFLGFPWLRKRKSGIIFGIAEDAKFISGKIAEA